MTKRQKKRFMSLLLAVVIGLVGYYFNQPSAPPGVLGSISPGYYRITEFADGDTIGVDMNDKSERVRLIGVDTPETHDPRKPVQCFGQAASDFTKKLIGNRPVRLESDDQSQNRDRYNRLLRYVYLPDGKLVQAEIIREGYGFAYLSFPFSKSAYFAQLQTEAREQGRGLWARCSPVVNANGGFTSNAE